MSNPELPVIQKTYDLLKWTSERVARFPRVHRDSLGVLVLARLNELFDVLLEAKYTRDRGALLNRANVLVEQLRFRVRLAFDLRCLRATGYGFAASELDAVGRMVGGWRKVTGRSDCPRTALTLREPPTARLPRPSGIESVYRRDITSVADPLETDCFRCSAPVLRHKPR